MVFRRRRDYLCHRFLSNSTQDTPPALGRLGRQLIGACERTPPALPVPRTTGFGMSRTTSWLACAFLTLLASSLAVAQSVDSAAVSGVLLIDGFAVTLSSPEPAADETSTSGTVVVPFLGDARLPVRIEGLGRDANGRFVARRVAWTGDRQRLRLPIGDDRTPLVHAVALEITDEGSAVTARCAIALPGLGPDATLPFSSRTVPVGPLGPLGDVALKLEEDIRLVTPEGVEYRFDGSTVTIDSAGLRDASLSLGVTFPRAWMLPIERYTTGNADLVSVDAGARDVARVTAEVRYEYDRAVGDDANTGLRNWVARGAMPSFALATQPDVMITDGELIVDQSLALGAPDPQWVGMKVLGATLQLPPAFRDSASGAPVRLASEEIIVEDGGVTLSAALASQVPIRFGDWPATLESAELVVETGAITRARVGGTVEMPELDRRLPFTGTLASRHIAEADDGALQFGGYVLALGAADGVRLARWRSTVSIANGSIELAAGDGAARALLSGTLSVDSTIGRTRGIDLRDIHFEGLGMRTGSREIAQPLWSHASPQHGLGAYPFSITRIGYATRDDGLRALRFSFGMNLAESSGAIMASGEIDVLEVLRDILGTYLNITDTTFDDDHKITRVTLAEVSLTDALTLSGVLYHYQGDATYGDGWYGKLQAYLLRAKTDIVGQFGTMNAGTDDQYRYWFFDTRVKWPKGLPLGTTGAAWYGIIGGLWHHMHRSPLTYPPGVDPPLIDSVSAGIGISASGFRFVPHDTTAGGFELGGIFGSYPNPRMVMCDLSVGADITESHSLGQVFTNGTVRIAEKKVFGMGSGSYTWNIAFSAAMHFDPFDIEAVVTYDYDKAPLRITNVNAQLKLGDGDWYFKIGQPSQRVKVSFGPVPLADGYLMMGSQLPGDELEPMLASAFPQFRQLFAAGGAGMSLGARLAGWDWGGSWHGLGFHIVLRVGFGLAVRDYDGACDAQGNPKELGINGWYALGSMYGKLRIGVELWGFNPSIDVTAVAIGGGPNPLWIKGRVKVKWLGSFSFSGGTPPRTCDRSLALPADFIRSVEPGTGDTASPFTWEVATFQSGIGEEFEMEVLELDLSDPNKPPETFRLRPVLKEFTLKRNADAAPVPGDLSTNQEARTATIAPLDALDGSTMYRARVVVAADVYDSVNRSWKRWTDGANEVTRDTTVTFLTTPRRRVIPEWNIAFTTPLARHRDHYPRDGAGPARVHLKTGAGYLLDPPARIAVRFVARNNGVDGPAVETEASVHGKAIDYILPELMTGTFYRGEIVRKGAPGSGGGAVPDSTVLSWHFRTSAYGSLSDKIADMSLASITRTLDTGWLEMVTCSDVSDVHLGRRMQQPMYPELAYALDRAGEGFDELELRGLTYDVGQGPRSIPPMLHVRSLSTSPWHVGFYQDTVLRLADKSLELAVRSQDCGADVAAVTQAYAHLRTNMTVVDTIRAMPLLSDDEIAAGVAAAGPADHGRLSLDFRDELVAWRFWTQAVLADSCRILSCGTTDPTLHAALDIRWRPLDPGRYDLSAWYDGRWWRSRVVGGEFIGADPVIVPGILSFDYAP